MKKLTSLLFICSFGIPSFTNAQNDDEAQTGLLRIEASAGIYTTKDIYSNSHFPSSDVWGKNATGTYFLGLSFYRYKKLELTVSLGYQQAHIDNPLTFYNGSTSQQDELNVYYITFLPQARLNWISSEDNKFELYSSFGMGLTRVNADYKTMNSADESYFIPAFHINGIGIRIGDKFGGFMEMGFGAKGLMSAGLSYRL